jgi:hypothetical protein
LRSRTTRNGSKGCELKRSMTTNATSRATLRASSPRVFAEPQPSVEALVMP